jgi:hypothetical protein
VAGKAASIATYDVLVTGSGNLDLWTCTNWPGEVTNTLLSGRRTRAVEICAWRKAKDVVVGLNQGIVFR